LSRFASYRIALPWDVPRANHSNALWQVAGQHCFDAAVAKKQIDKVEEEAIGQNTAP